MNKKNLILGGILAVLIAVAYIYQGPLKNWQSNLGKPSNFLAKLDVDQVDRIEIANNGEDYGIEKSGDRWKISGTKEFYVKDGVIDNLLSQLKAAVKAEIELAGENKDKKNEFNTDDSGISVKLTQGENVLAEFIVGDYSGVYISKPGSDKTYAIKADIGNIFDKNNLYNKEIFNSEADKIANIRFQYPNREFTVEREITKASEDSGASDVLGDWEGVIPYKFRVDQDKIKKVLDIMSKLSAVKIPRQSFAGTGLEKNLIIIQATGEGIDNTLMVGDDNGEGLYFAKRGDSDNIYLISEEQRDVLDQTIRSLR